MLEKAPSRRESVMLFARNFFKHPRMLGSLIPSSRFLIDELLAQVNWSGARVVVEYGPGVGSFTTEILRRMHPDAKLIVIEMNEDFVSLLRSSYDDPRLHVVHGSADDVQSVLAGLGLEHADYVISGIPFSTMPPAVRDSILQQTHDVLGNEGAFLVYQFSGDVLPHLKGLFREVRQDFELLNILPARLFFCFR
ncbi:MAG TPA: rRNA adenine N-6-methyltransferase family protein [Thermoanaerobaculia bacterium]|nr:rRNA adenine N-6-methyltransferase family protein [Thermoanaerobaculia bacterium]